MREGGGRRALSAALALGALAVCLGCEKTGIRGGAVSLDPGVSPGTNLTEIIWKRGMNLVAEWEPDSPLWIAPRFTGRMELDSATGSLTLIKLQLNDSGSYSVEFVGSKPRCSSFTLWILEHPPPPRLNCTDIGDRIRVSCELNASYTADKTYEWKYQKSNKQIPGNGPEIFLEKDGDLLENVTCVIHILDTNTASSIRLRDCIQTGTASQRKRAWLSLPCVALAAVAGIMICLWKKGCVTADAVELPPEEQRLREEGSRDLEAPPEEQRLHEEGSRDSEENGSKEPSVPAT